MLYAPQSEGSLKPMFLDQMPRPPPDWQFRGNPACPNILPLTNTFARTSAWGLWKLPNGLYYPAKVIDVKLDDCMATVRWLEPAYRDFMNMATFDIPFAQCSEAIDPDLPHELEAHEYLIESQCGSSLASLLHQSMVSSSTVNEANLAFGPGCGILSYCAIGYAMGSSGEEAFELTAQGLLFRDQLSYELAWQATRQCLTLTPIEDAQFVHSHRIPDTSIELPAIQILIGPLRQLHTSAAEAPNTIRGTADRAPTCGGTSSVSSAPSGIPKLLIRKGENGYSVESLPRPGIIVETGDWKTQRIEYPERYTLEGCVPLGLRPIGLN
ncbi:hypothetical protein JB92DRAFT_3167152 [Gautieria morchelliformis]|nr:hypothetical protein JB92DRAFT_3167152 [Gautieria morchelliformis]